ncbi:hypothetical protein BGX27_004494 [Mortierella sp. AM989]|nr:hypothetical protein BGX27_004494 [Mortierella sp. AM989]
MSSIDPSIRTLQDDIQASASTIDKTTSLNGTLPSDSPATLTQLQSNTSIVPSPPQPTVAQYDPVYLQKREDALRATGEVLHQRCLKKMERLHQLVIIEQLRIEHGKNLQPTSKAASSFQDQVVNKMTRWEVFPEVLPEVTKLRTRQMVQNSIHDYGVMIPRLTKELEDTKAELASEKKLLKELHEINQALQARRKDLKRLVESGISQESSQGRQKMLETRVKVQELMRELTGFLSRHYPPIQPDPDDPATFELKHVLEDIMNLSVSQPADPYVVLVPGEYYPPHIEQLINAGIAVRHPRDAQKLRLIDFYS